MFAPRVATWPRSLAMSEAAAPMLDQSRNSSAANKPRAASISTSVGEDDVGDTRLFEIPFGSFERFGAESAYIAVTKRIGILLVIAACGPNASPAPENVPATPPVAEIHNGDLASSCQWPSTVALIGAGSPFCSGTLIDPRFVLTAAHCVDDGQVPDVIGFGEDGFAPQRTVPVVGCTNNPLYYQSLDVDMAVCELAMPVTDVQPTPIALGCELDALQPGAVVHIVGYGNHQSWFNEFGDFVDSVGLGPKRFTPQSIFDIRPDAEEIDLVGVDEFSSACHGDSGGGAFVQLADGTWRVFGIAQSLFVPPDGSGETGGATSGAGFIDPGSSEGGAFITPPETTGEPQTYEVCGPGTTYTLIADQMPWLEGAMGLDASPCFTAEGAWDPGPACTPFPTQLEQSVGSWVDGCVGAVGGVPQCGDLDPDPTTGGETTSTTGPAPDPTTTTTTADPTTGDPQPPPTTDPTGDATTTDDEPSGTVGTGDADTDSDTDGGADGDADGLLPRGCSVPGNNGGGAVLMLLGLLAVRGRRGPYCA